MGHPCRPAGRGVCYLQVGEIKQQIAISKWQLAQLKLTLECVVSKLRGHQRSVLRSRRAANCQLLIPE